MGHLLTVLQKKKIIVQDSFIRADNAVSMGNANTGQLWQVYSGTWGILSNQAYRSAIVANNKNAAVIDSGISNCIVQSKLSIAPNNTRVIFRSSDIDNGFMVQPETGTSYVIYRLQAGVYTKLATIGVGATANGDVIKLRCVGASIKLFINGIERSSITDSFNQTATKQGIGTDDVTTTSRWANFIVEAI